MEFWDVYDTDRRLTGKKRERGRKPKQGEFRLTVHICVFNTEGDMLIQKRQPFKDGWPGMWDVTAAGSALAGEKSQEAAMRELFEEVGIAVNLSGRRPHLTVSFHNGFDDIYLIEKEVDAKNLKLQKEEVAEVKWASKEEIKRLIQKEEFIPYYEDIIGVFFDMRKGYGKFTTDAPG